MPMPKLNDIQTFLNRVDGHRTLTAELARQRSELAADREKLIADREKLIADGKALGFEKGAVREMLDEAPAEGTRS